MLYKHKYLLLLLLLCLNGCGFSYYTGYFASISLKIIDQENNHIEGGHITFLNKKGDVTFKSDIKNTTYLDWNDSKLNKKNIISEVNFEKSTFIDDRSDVKKIKESTKAIISANNCKSTKIDIKFIHKQVSRSILIANKPLNRYIFDDIVVMNCSG